MMNGTRSRSNSQLDTPCIIGVDDSTINQRKSTKSTHPSYYNQIKHCLSLYRWLIYTITPLTAMYSLYVFIIIGNKCAMSANLKDLFVHTTSFLHNNHLEYFLDFGSLLGAIRDDGLIPWEFDIDIGVQSDDCSRIVDMSTQLNAQYKYHIYDQLTWIPQKYNPVLGFSGYITSPCARIYDENDQYYVDIYWYKKYSAHELLSGTAQHIRPNGDILHPQIPQSVPDEYYNTLTDNSEAVWCNDDGHTGDDKGGCRPDSWIYPLQSIRISIDPLTQVDVSVPAKSDRVLSAMYEDTWMIPRAKGYKFLVCGWIDSVNINIVTLVYVISVCIILYVGSQTQRYSLLNKPQNTNID